MGEGLIRFFQNIATLLVGPVGIAVVLCLVAYGILEAIAHRRIGPAMWPIIGGAAFYAIPWLITAVMQAQ